MSTGNDSTAGSLFRKVIDASEAERNKILDTARPSVRAEVELLLELDAEARRDGLLHSLQPSASEHGRFNPGTIINDRYRIVSLVGRGGMGEVYRADDLQIGEPIALKFPSWNFKEDQQQSDRFYAEVRSARQVSHPNICQVYDVGEFEGDTFISMEYIDGEDLKSLLRRIGRLSHQKAIELGSQICGALAAAHSKGVLHRDLKPANVMIDGKGHARITDFGLASIAQSKPGSPERAGTPAYMAPEQFLHGETNVQSDLYSLGLILFELFTGQYAHSGASLDELVQLHKNGSGPVRPSDLIDDIEPVVDVAVRRCLDSAPSGRPSSAAAVATQLNSGQHIYVADLPDEDPSPELVATYDERGVLKPRSAVILSLLTCIGIATLFFISGSSRQLSVLALAQPEILQNDARWTIKHFGYSIENTDAASGFTSQNTGGESGAAFWYRQSPEPLIGIQIPLEVKAANYGTIVDLNDPPWTRPGMIGMTLSPTRKQDSSRATLKWFRATPLNNRITATNATGSVDWKTWFNEEVIGFDLDSLQPASWRNVPPDAFDQQFSWEGVLPGDSDNIAGESVYVEVASFRGRPTYFHAMTQEEFDNEVSTPTQTLPQNTRTGFGLPISNVLTVLVISFFARRNWRLRRCDRAGAAKIATFVLVGQMIGWLCLTSHVFATSEYFLVRDGLKSAIGSAFTAWVVYLALEPFVRKNAPKLLASWSCLLDGNWNNPIVGRDILYAMSAAVWVEVILNFIHAIPGARRLEPLYISLGGWDGVIGVAIGGGANFLTWMLIIFTTCVAIYRFTGQRWLACAFIFLGIGLSAAARDGNFTFAYLYVAAAVLPALGTVRLGLLFLVAFAIFDYWLQQPITTDTSAFYFPTSVFWAIVVVMVAVMSAYIAIGNRRKTLMI